MKLLKKLLLMLVLALTVIGITGCEKDERIQIGILQLATHPALDKAREGFIEALEAGGYGEDKVKITVKNPEGLTDVLGQMANSLIYSSDLVLGIATFAGRELMVVAKNENKDIPILFTASTNPAVDFELDSNPEANMTGTSDIGPLKEQIALIKEINPDYNTLGIMYTITEPNSEYQVGIAKAEAEALGMTVKVLAITQQDDVQTRMKTFVNNNDIEVIFIPTDNNIATKMLGVKMAAQELKMPVICSEEGMTTDGGLITIGIDYKELGRMTGEIAVRILNGEKAKDIPYESLKLDQCQLILNMETVADIGITIPERILNDARKIKEN